MRRLYVGLRRDIVRMELVCGIRSGQVGIYCIRRGSRHRALGHTPAIRRSIWSGMRCPPNHTAGNACIPELLFFYLFGEVMRAGLPFCLGHASVGQMVVLVPRPRHRIGVTTYALGNFCLGVRVRIPRLPGPQSIYQSADLDHLEATATSSSGCLQWL